MPQTVIFPLPYALDDPERAAEPALPYACAVAARTGGRFILASAVGALPKFDPPARSFSQPSAASQAGRLSEEALAAVQAAGRPTTAGQAMRGPVVTVTEEEPVGAVVTKLLDRGLTRLPVVRDSVPAVIVTRHGRLRLKEPEGGGRRW
jgi:hypothetical protein